MGCPGSPRKKKREPGTFISREYCVRQSLNCMWANKTTMAGLHARYISETSRAEGTDEKSLMQ